MAKRKSASRRSKSLSRRRRAPIVRQRRAWVNYSDDRLLDMRLKDLNLGIERTVLARRVRKLYAELEAKRIRFRPHIWLSSEWFAPDGVPGFAIPFYLAHPRLMKLEAKQMLQVEGGTLASCMRILRHEAGHAIDTAYRLHFKKRWREAFGRSSEPYPLYYTPKPNSRNFVLNLDAWYAQVHPSEDFAETFAVWLTPRLNWRQRYGGWPGALKKLQFVNDLMMEIAGKAPPVRSRARIEPINQLSQTLREHYAKKRARYASEWPDFLDRDLCRLFSNESRYNGQPTAASFLRRLRPEIRGTVAEWTGAHHYTIDQILQDMIDRCRALRLRLTRPPRVARTQAIIMLTVQTMTFLHAGRYEIAV